MHDSTVCEQRGALSCRISLLACGLLLLGVTAAQAAVSSDARCQSLKNKDAGNYGFCLAKAQMKLVTTAGTCSATTATICYRDADCPVSETCNKDVTKYDASVSKCDSKFSLGWNKWETNAEGNCPTTGDENDVRTTVADFGACMAEDLNGAAATCNVGTLQTNLDACDTSLTGCTSDLATCNAGTATAADVLSGQTFSSSAGLGLAGTMPNRGNMSFTPGPAAQTIPAGRYDGTGSVLPCRQMDVIFAESGLANRACLAQGLGSHCSEVDVTLVSRYSARVALSDLDADGDLDAVFANYDEPSRVCLNDAAGDFSCANVGADANSTNDVALGDLNGDGHVDAVFANDTYSANGGLNRACFGNGTGGFSTCSDVGTDMHDSYAVALGDLNGDGDLDAVFANREQVSRACIGDGVGAFSCGDVGSDVNSTNGVALGDMNGDGDLDAVFANDTYSLNGGINRVCFGDGTGAFSGCSDVGTQARFSLGVALGDLDHDGDLDVVVGNYRDEGNSVCLGDGTGVFSCSDIAGEARKSDGIALADVNGDGDLDAVFANWGQFNRLCFGDGAGGFSCSNVGEDANYSNGVALGHLD